MGNFGGVRDDVKTCSLFVCLYVGVREQLLGIIPLRQNVIP